ncbi:hypothetical protein E4T56_gene10261 [Termitomyces sp. T112]|nr:hypothetical protein E4T56_gene10261 [Termitomyces sp. T112]
MMGDMVYVSTKNFTYPKGFPRKLIPKYEGPYQITEDFRNNSFRVAISKNMKQRGIHDMFHSALLRIHKPNDDQLFLGRLDEQIVEPELNEWAAECIVAHHGARTKAMFEVLWKAGDRSWMTYEQVKELNLLEPYLELLGYEKIEELIDVRTGKPPLDDLQIILGLPPTTTGLPTYAHTLRVSAITFPLLHHPSLMGHPNPYKNRGNSGKGPTRPRFHPYLAVDSTTGLVTLRDPQNPSCWILLHPYQIQLYLDFDLEVRQTHGNPHSAMPIGYPLDHQTHTWSRVNRPFPNGYLLSTFVDPRLNLLVTLGFISKQGDVDKQTIEDAVRAWRAPAGQLVQRTKQYHARRANPYSVSSSKSGNSTRFYSELCNNYSASPAPVGSSSATASSSTPHYPRSNSGSPSSTPVSSVPSPARLSHAAIAAAITLGGLVIKEKDPKDKGKGKATEEEEMEVDAADIPLPKDDFLDEELQDLLRSPKTHTKKAD